MSADLCSRCRPFLARERSSSLASCIDQLRSNNVDVYLESALSEGHRRDLVEAEEELQLYDAEISRLNELISSITATRDGIRRVVGEHKSIRAPIRRLPPDILGEIFSIVQELLESERIIIFAVDSPLIENPTASLGPAIDSMLALSSVCCHWQAVISSSPLLWTAIEVALPAPAEKLQRRLTRALEQSGTALLSVRIRYRHDTSPTPTLNAIRMLGLQSHRIKELCIIGNVDPFCHPGVFDPEHDLAFPNMKVLTYSFSGGWPVPVIDGQYKWLGKGLPSGSISDRAVIPSVRLLNGTLMHYIVGALAKRIQAPRMFLNSFYTSQIREVLLVQPHVEDLEIVLTIGDKDPPADGSAPVHLPDLTKLSIIVLQSNEDDTWQWKDPLEQIFDQLHVPRLTDLSIDHGTSVAIPHPWSFQPFERFVSKHTLGETLLSFKFTDTDGLTQASLLGILRLLPSLQRFEISGVGVPRPREGGTFSPSPIMPSFFDHLIVRSPNVDSTNSGVSSKRMSALPRKLWGNITKSFHNEEIILPNLVHINMALNRRDLLPDRLAKAVDMAESRMGFVDPSTGVRRLEEMILYIFGDLKDPITIRSLERIAGFQRRGWKIYYYILEPS